MAGVKWVKLYVDLFDDPKIKHLRKLPEGNNVVLIWVMLLTMAGRCNSCGKIFLTESIPYTAKMLAETLGFKEKTVTMALVALESLNMIDRSGDHITIQGWEEHQNEDKLAEIRARDRERKRLKQAEAEAPNDPEDVHGNSTEIPRKFHGNSTERSTEIPRNVPRNVRGTSAEIPLIEEEEEDRKEIHSFVLSRAREETKRKFLTGSLGGGVVMLSEEQLDDLLDKLSLDEFNKYTAIVRDCELNGKPYKKKTHYQAILDMAKRDRGLR